jgi:hypothetical protein
VRSRESRERRSTRRSGRAEQSGRLGRHAVDHRAGGLDRCYQTDAFADVRVRAVGVTGRPALVPLPADVFAGAAQLGLAAVPVVGEAVAQYAGREALGPVEPRAMSITLVRIVPSPSAATAAACMRSATTTASSCSSAAVTPTSRPRRRWR